MKPGNLVKTTRASIGYPKGTVGLVVNVVRNIGLDADLKFVYVQICGHEKRDYNTERRYLDRDLELVT